MTAQQNDQAERLAPFYRGSCLCGGIQYELHGELGEIIQCHCRICRKANGTAFATNSPVKVTDFKLTQGEHLLKKYTSSVGTERCFCSECGSPLFGIKQDAPEFYRLRIGSLDTPIVETPSMHIFVKDKAEWDSITDGLAQYPSRPE